MSYNNVSHCGNDHTEWLKSIDFYDNELTILKERLLEIANKNSGTEAMAGVEHFQNQFIIQGSNIDELRNSIHRHAGKVAADAKIHAGKIETVLADDHDLLKEKVLTFEKVINDLRHEFNQFLSKWM